MHNYSLQSGIWSVLDLHRPCACCNMHCKLICELQMMCPKDSFLVDSHYLWFLHSFYNTPPSTMIPKPSEAMVQYALIRAEHSLVSYSLCFVQLWVSVLIIIYCKQKLLYWRVKDVLIYGHKNYSLTVRLILCPFGRIVLKFLLGLVTWLVLGTCPNKGDGFGFLPEKSTWKLSRKYMFTPMLFVPTLHQEAYLASQSML